MLNYMYIVTSSKTAIKMGNSTFKNKYSLCLFSEMKMFMYSLYSIQEYKLKSQIKVNT